MTALSRLTRQLTAPTQAAVASAILADVDNLATEFAPCRAIDAQAPRQVGEGMARAALLMALETSFKRSARDDLADLFRAFMDGQSAVARSLRDDADDAIDDAATWLVDCAEAVAVEWRKNKRWQE